MKRSSLGSYGGKIANEVLLIWSLLSNAAGTIDKGGNDERKKGDKKGTNCDDFSSVGSQAPISLASLDFLTNYNLITKKADTMSGDNETEQLEGAVADIDLGEAAGYKPPAEKTIDEILKADQEDEALKKYKATLLGKAFVYSLSLSLF